MVNIFCCYLNPKYIHLNTVTASNTSTVSVHAWEESTGLLSSLIPQPNGGTAALTNPQTFNSSTGDLKLGPPPISEELRSEAEHVLRAQSLVEQDPAAHFDSLNIRPAVPGVTAPSESDLPPLPPSFKAIDVKREVEKVRDARKRIKLEPSALASVDINSPQGGAARARALPSICAYTLHDTAEG